MKRFRHLSREYQSYETKHTAHYSSSISLEKSFTIPHEL